MKAVGIKVIFIIGSLFFSIPLFATNYYVSPTGNDGSAGNFANPWLTIQKAANVLVAGDTVFIMQGTYNEIVITQNSGNSNNYIVYTAYADDTVTIDGTSVPMLNEYGLMNVYRAAFIVVSELNFHNSGDSMNNVGILVQESSNIIIKNNYTYNTKSSGIGVWYCANITISGNEVELACNTGEQECISISLTDSFEVFDNEVHDSGPYINGGEGIDAKQGSSNGKIYTNHVYNIKAVGIYVDAWDTLTQNIEVYNNVVHDIAGNGIDISSEQGGILTGISTYNNIIYNCELVGINLSDCCIGTHPVRNVSIINNTIVKNGQAPWGGGINIDNLQIQNIVIRNNIVSQNYSFQIALADMAQLSNMLVDHNLIDGFRNDSLEIQGLDSIVGDPLFTDAVMNGFHLTPASPAIDNGSATGAPSVDHMGTSRPQNGLYDIGAYEFSVSFIDEPEYNHSPISIFPLPARDVVSVTIQLKNEQEAMIEIYDLIGKKVHQSTYSGDNSGGWNTIIVDINNFTPGVYLISATTNETVTSGKVIVTK